MKKFSKKAFRKTFVQHFCNHEWFPKHIGGGYIIYVCQKCGKTMTEEVMCEKEFNSDKF